MTLRAAAVLGISLAAAALLTGCYYPQPPAYAYYPPGCMPETPPAAQDAEPPPSAAPPDTPSEAAPQPPAGTPCRLVPVYAYPSYPYYYPYYPGYYGYPGYYPYGYPAVSVGIGGRFRL